MRGALVDDDCDACLALGAELCDKCSAEVRAVVAQAWEVAPPLHAERRTGVRAGRTRPAPLTHC